MKNIDLAPVNILLCEIEKSLDLTFAGYKDDVCLSVLSNGLPDAGSTFSCS